MMEKLDKSKKLINLSKATNHLKSGIKVGTKAYNELDSIQKAVTKRIISD